MNICILWGKIISEIEYKFIINSKNKAIAQFEMELSNKSIVKVQAYDEMADYVYRKLKIGDFVIVYGKISADAIIANRQINKINKKILL